MPGLPGGRGRTDLVPALDLASRVVRRHAIVFLVSDFLAAGYEKPLRIAHRRHDIIPISITDDNRAGLRPKRSPM